MAHAAHASSHAAPHGGDAQDGHHGHVIVPPSLLKTVLIILLVFTALTVATAQLEVWAMDYFHITLPHWVNIVGAMTIAVIKAVLVMAIFMQLRYDNMMNSLVMFFTFFAVGLFLFFSGLDLFTRDAVTPWKNQYVVEGGTGGLGVGKQDPNMSLVAASRKHWLSVWGPEKFAELEAAAHHGAAHAAPEASSANMSRPRGGLSGALNAAPAGGAHGEHTSANAHDSTHAPADTHAAPAMPAH